METKRSRITVSCETRGKVADEWRQQDEILSEEISSKSLVLLLVISWSRLLIQESLSMIEHNKLEDQ